MKLLYYFLALKLAVTGQRIGKRIESLAHEKGPEFFFDDEDIIPYGTKPGTKTEIATPMTDEILGIEVTEMESLNKRPCYVDYCANAGWESLDSNDGTGDHESFNRPTSRCIEVRVKYSHQPSLTMPVKFVYYDGNAWNWGKSSRYGFHCFHGLQNNEVCDDFEFRTFSDC